jgi:23S rRNA pseudouridine955/2504/2580 synthase
VILLARTREAAGFFSSLFERSIVQRRYRAVCCGIPKPESGIIRLDLDVKGKTGVFRKSETSYKLLSPVFFDTAAEDEQNVFSLLELELGTGRMHQIRRHLSRIGHPLLGDDKYGDFTLNGQLRKSLRLKHLLLHASRLILPPLPELPKGLDISAPTPEYWRSLTLTSIPHFQ